MPLAKGENIEGYDLPSRWASRHYMDTFNHDLDSEPSLCALCHQLDLGELLSNDRDDRALRLPHHATYAALASSASLGCQMCAVLQQGIFDETTDFDRQEVVAHHKRLDSFDIGTSFAISAYRVVDTDKNSPYWVYKDESRQNHISFVARPDAGYYYRIHYDRPGAIRTLESTGSRTVRALSLFLVPWYFRAYVARPIGKRPNFNLCRSWIYTCASRHYKCPALEEREMPTRVIDVGSWDEQPRLIETDGQKGEYVTLTHCWGGHQPPTTNEDTYLLNLKEIPLDKLPLTFQDAVVATRHLGFRYLWIDCFCIIQGNAEDFQRECAKMAQIFENSAVTIAGPAAQNPYGGFLHDRPTFDTLPCKLSKRVYGLPNEDFFLCNSQHWYDHRLKKDGWENLDTRAWIFQERQLSPRVMYFGRREVYFECLETDCWESVRRIPIYCYDDLVRSAFTAANTLGGYHEVWYRLVEIYSTRQLTAENDRLPALSGIAHRLQSRFGDEYDSHACWGLFGDDYLAGLWRGDLFNGLLWHPGTDSEDRNSLKVADDRAPSWSWASCDREVTFVCTKRKTFKALQQRCKIVHAEATAIGEDQCGEVHAGTLTLYGKVRHDRIHRLCIDEDLHEYELLLTGDDEHTPTVVSDVHPSRFSKASQDERRAVLVLEMASVIQQDNGLTIALILEEVNGKPQTFRRLGLAMSGFAHTQEGHFDSRRCTWFNACPREVVQII